MGSLSHEGGKARQQRPGPPRDAGMFAWVRNTQPEADAGLSNLDRVSRRGGSVGFCAAPGLSRSFGS